MKYTYRVHLLLIGFLFFCVSMQAQKPVQPQSFETTTYQDVPHFYRGQTRVNLETGYPIAIYQPGDVVSRAAPETMAREYLNRNRTLFGFSTADLDDLRLHYVRESAAGTTVRLRQFHQGYPVGKSEITISIRPDYTIGFVMNSFAYGGAIESTTPRVSATDARAIAADYIGLSSETSHESNELMVLAKDRQKHLVYRVHLVAYEPQGQWDVMVDTQTGEVRSAQNVACYYHDHRQGIQPALPPSEVSIVLDGTGNVFDPDPLATAQATYGVGGFSDNNDSDVTQLVNEQVSVTLRDITFNGSEYQLIGPWAEVQDFEAPNRGLFSQATPNWNFNRSNNAFEAVNVYYHIDASMRYLNVDLGLNIRPLSYTGGVRFDPSGLNNADNSYYSGALERLAFGDGGVDDAEDSDVIHHELGHGLHDWVTGGNLSQVNGLSEGSGDYWAVSYNRSFANDWAANEAPHQWVFRWDGHNEFWNGRVTNISAIYPAGLSGSIHASGQLWATSMMLVYDAIGKEKTDVIFWEGLGMTNGSSSQNDAANAVYTAAINLGYTDQERTAIHTILTARGYTLPMLVLPVDWLAFTATAQEENVLLKWTTANEVDNDYFTVERSADGRTFVDLGRIASTATNNENSATLESEKEYNFIDSQPLNGSNVYRIKQTDYDGSTSYSGLQTVNFRKESSWTVSPNPAINNVSIFFDELATQESLQASVLDLAGRTVIEARFAQPGTSSLAMDVTALPIGLYVLQLTRNGITSVQRFVKQ